MPAGTDPAEPKGAESDESLDPGVPFDEEVTEPETGAPEDAARKPEGNVEDSAEVAEEKAPETAKAPAPAADDAAPDLSTFPETIREAVRKYGDVRVSGLQSKWQPEVEKARAAQEKAEALDKFNDRFAKDPDGLIADMVRLYKETHGRDAPVALVPRKDEPQDPGEPPDPTEDPKAFGAWMVARDRYRDSVAEKRQAERERKLVESMEPARNLAAQAQAARKMQAIKEKLKASDEEFAEVMQVAARARTSEEEGFSVIAENVRLKKELATLKAGRQKQTAEAIRGTEERPGLPRTGARRQRPEPTGNLVRDVAAELAHDGVAFPEGE